MKVKEILKTNNSVNALEQLLNEMLGNLTKELSTYYATFPLIHKYKPVIEKLTQAYEKKFNQKCYITSFNNNKLYDEIKRKKDRLNFSIDSFSKAMYYEVSLLLAKYDSIHECQIKLSFMNMLLKNYKYYIKSYDDQYILSFDINILKNLYNSIMETSIKNLPIIKDNAEMQKIISEKCFVFPDEDPDDYFNVDKPTKAQHLTMLFDEEMTQRDKVRIIAVHYECSEKTAERYMKKFGLWNKVKGTKTPKDNSPKPTADTSLFEDLSFNPSINTKNDFRL